MYVYIYMLWYVIYILYSKLRRGNAVGFRSLCIVYVYHILYILYRIQQGLIKLMGNKGEQTRFTWTWSLNCFIDRNTAEDSAQDLSDTRHLYKFPQLEWHLPSSWPRGPTLQHLDHSYRKSAVSCRASKNTFLSCQNHTVVANGHTAKIYGTVVRPDAGLPTATWIGSAQHFEAWSNRSRQHPWDRGVVIAGESGDSCV